MIHDTLELVGAISICNKQCQFNSSLLLNNFVYDPPIKVLEVIFRDAFTKAIDLKLFVKRNSSGLFGLIDNGIKKVCFHMFLLFFFFLLYW